MSGDEMDAAIDEVTAILKARGIAFVGGFARVASEVEMTQENAHPPLHVRVRACAPDGIPYDDGRAMAVNCLNAIMHQAKSIAGVEDSAEEATLN